MSTKFTLLIDYVENLVTLFKSVEKSVIFDENALTQLINALIDKRKFKVYINGIGGNWVNVRIEVKTGKDNWKHLIIHNRMESRKGNFNDKEGDSNGMD